MNALKILREQRGITQQQLADAIGVQKGAVANWEQGIRSPSSTSRKKLAEYFNVPESHLLDASIIPQGADFDPAPIQKVPVISWVAANRFSETADPYPLGQADEFLETTAKGGRMFGLVVKHDCMTPIFQENDRIIVNPDMEPNSGDYVIVRDESKNEATFKQFKRYGDKIFLHPLNPKYQDIEMTPAHSIVGVVIEKITRFK